MSSINVPQWTDSDTDNARLFSSERLCLLRSYEAWTETMDAFAYWILLWTNGEDYFLYRYPSRWDLPPRRTQILSHPSRRQGTQVVLLPTNTPPLRLQRYLPYSCLPPISGRYVRQAVRADRLGSR